MPDASRLRVAALAALAVVGIAVLIVVLRGCGGDETPSDDAAKVTPATALVYVHASTDDDRDAVQRLLTVARRFPGYPNVRDALLGRLGAKGAEEDLRRWLGDEGSLAFLGTTPERADFLLALATTDEEETRTYIERRIGEPVGVTPYKGTEIRNYKQFQAALVGGFLLVGPFEAVTAAVDLAEGRTKNSLAVNATYEEATKGLPDDSVVEGYASEAGVRRLLAPAGGVLGIVGRLLNRPRLKATALAVSPAEDGAQLVSRTISRAGAPKPRTYEPALLGSAPADVIAVEDGTGLDGVGARLITGQGSRIAGLGDILQRGRRLLEQQAKVDVDKDVLPLFAGETLTSITPAFPSPILTVVARAQNEERTRAALRRLQDPLARILVPQSPAAKTPPAKFKRVELDGTEAFRLDIRSGFSLTYALEGGRLIVSTSPQGVAAALDPDEPLEDTESFKSVIPDREGVISSLVFLDFDQLLGLGEQAGLADNPQFARLKADLQRIRAVGATTSAEKNTTTLELFLEIP